MGNMEATEGLKYPYLITRDTSSSRVDLEVLRFSPSDGCPTTATYLASTQAMQLKDRYGEPQRGGSEWELIKILLEGDEDSNKTNTASNTRLRPTTQVGHVHASTEVLLDLGTNTQLSEPKHTDTHRGNLHGLLPVLHRSDRWPTRVRPVTPVRPVDSAGQAGGYSSRTTSVPESLNDFSRP
jgi:hypothetical protein